MRTEQSKPKTSSPVMNTLKSCAQLLEISVRTVQDKKLLAQSAEALPFFKLDP